MLVYLDTAQLAWLERASEDARRDFGIVWRDSGCELAVSLQILQEVQKRGSPEDVSNRSKTIMALAPLRGIPAGSAGVAVEEVTSQVRELIGRASEDPLAVGREALFPPMTPETVTETLADYDAQFGRFNVRIRLTGEAFLQKHDQVGLLLVGQLQRKYLFVELVVLHAPFDVRVDDLFQRFESAVVHVGRRADDFS